MSRQHNREVLRYKDVFILAIQAIREGASLVGNTLQQSTAFVEAPSMTDAPERHYDANPKPNRQGLWDTKKPRYSDT
jgi:hypothetical protein